MLMTYVKLKGDKKETLTQLVDTLISMGKSVKSFKLDPSRTKLFITFKGKSGSLVKVKVYFYKLMT